MSIDQSMLSALDLIYAAATDESLWPEVVRKMTAMAESQAASFSVLDTTKLRHPVFHYLNVEKRMVDEARGMRDYLEEGMMELDPTVLHIAANPSQRLVRDSALLSESEKDRHPYYAWHQSFSDTRHRMAGMISLAPHIHSGIALHRTRQMGDFEDRHVEQFLFLLPHVERAVRISFQLGTLGAWRNVTADLLDANPRAVIFLDRNGQVLFANRAASAMAAAGDGVMLSADGLSLLGRPDNIRLQHLIGAALDPHRQPPSTGVMWVSRRSGKRPFCLLVAPLAPEAMLVAAARPALCVVITDLENQRLVPEDRLKTLFGLTQAEARLAVRLAGGEALQDAAAALNIAHATARTQLGVIFRKTGTNRQGELVRLLLADIPSLSV